MDLTLFDMELEKEVDMGGTFDYFGELSHPDYTGISEEQYANRMILRDAMLSNGFKPLEEEWWHFTLEDEPYPDTYFTFPVNSEYVAEYTDKSDDGEDVQQPAAVDESLEASDETKEAADEEQETGDVQYVMYLGTNDKDTNQPVFTQDKAMEKAQEILISHFGGYTIQDAIGGWVDEDGTEFQEYTLVIYLSDTTSEEVYAAADELVSTFNQSSVLIQTNPTQTEFYSGAEAE